VLIIHVLLILSTILECRRTDKPVLCMGEFTVTSYRSVPNQTDSSPFHTSIGERTNNAVIAVSQDMLRDGRVRYGDVVFIEGVGGRVVLDTMHPRWKNRLDVWVATKKDEAAFHKKFKSRKLKVWKINAPRQRNTQTY
jgi:3D (Asp-Asp-Asp) domain-containing protein